MKIDYLPLFASEEGLSELISVPVKTRDNFYEIIIGADLLSKLDKLWKKLNFSTQVLIVTQDCIWKLYGEKLLASFNFLGINPVLHIVPDGESSKNNTELNRIYDVLTSNLFARDCVVLAFGGGVIGDLAGYAAASYMRGVNLIQVPTTLLAQVDSSVGGKTGINHPRGKNLIGAFYQPRAVIIDTDVLQSLPAREFLTGLGEIVKYGIIDDHKLFSFIEDNKEQLGSYSVKNRQMWQQVIEQSCRIKARIVSIDEKETGLRAILNLGHTIGHAVENVTDYQAYNHGEAVSIGIAAAAYISRNKGLIGAEVADRILLLLRALGLPVSCRDLDIKRIIGTIKLDKKVKNGTLRLILINKIGQVDIFSDITEAEIEKVLLEIN